MTPAPPARAALKRTSCHERPHAPARRRRAQAHAGARVCRMVAAPENPRAALAEHDRPTEVLHIGDHDPSGTHMFLAFLEDVEARKRESTMTSNVCSTFSA